MYLSTCVLFVISCASRLHLLPVAGELKVWVQTTKECPVVVDIMGIILGVIGAIVAIGLMLILMWKVFTTIHDRREYARFEKEQRLAKWDAVRYFS